jgi:hypothetical protein
LPLKCFVMGTDIMYFFGIHTVQHRHSQYARTLTPMNTRTQTLPYEHL